MSEVVVGFAYPLLNYIVLNVTARAPAGVYFPLVERYVLHISPNAIICKKKGPIAPALSSKVYT